MQNNEEKSRKIKEKCKIMQKNLRKICRIMKENAEYKKNANK